MEPICEVPAICKLILENIEGKLDSVETIAKKSHHALFESNGGASLIDQVDVLREDFKRVSDLRKSVRNTAVVICSALLIQFFTLLGLFYKETVSLSLISTQNQVLLLETQQKIKQLVDKKNAHSE